MSLMVLYNEESIYHENFAWHQFATALRSISQDSYKGIVLNNGLYNPTNQNTHFYTQHLQKKAIIQIQTHIPNTDFYVVSLFLDEDVLIPICIKRNEIKKGFQFIENEDVIKCQIIKDYVFQPPQFDSNDSFIFFNLSPFQLNQKNKVEQYYQSIKAFHQTSSCPIISLSPYGLYEGQIFDGYSQHFQNQLSLPSFSLFRNVLLSPTLNIQDEYEALLNHLGIGLKSYLQNTSSQKWIVGVSGGIDSALILVLLSCFFTPSQIIPIFMPGPFTSSMSQEDVYKLTNHLNLKLIEHSITETYQFILEQFAHTFSFSDQEITLTQENLQARLRSLILMTYSNEKQAIVINTSNKSEIAMGYSTLYGDSIGACSPLGDLYKTDIYQFTHFLQKKLNAPFPERILTRPPSAELKPNQQDSDTLLPYDTLDTILKLFLEDLKNPDYIAKKTQISEETITKIVKTILKNEYKRRQSPLLFKLRGEENNLHFPLP